jgi:glycosyltransferase involved in cell wall biosynthesis
MIFIVYSQVSEENLKGSIGMPEYSYYFVLRGFLPVLRELGQVVMVSNPEQEVDVIYDACRERGEGCVFISFSPPNKSAIGLRCPTFSVFAWEFDRIPDEAWDGDRKNDWRYVLSDHGHAITLSQYSAAVVKKAMGKDFPAEAIPVPVWDTFKDFRNRIVDRLSVKRAEISINGTVVDSRNYHITPDSFELLKPFSGFQIKNWSGKTLRLGFSKTDEFSAYLGGFYKPETWGTWSRITKPWVLLPYKLRGRINLTILARGYGHNVNKEIFVSLGNKKRQILLQEDFTETSVSFHLSKPENVLKFSGLDLTPIPAARDPRFMGIGLRHIEIAGDPGAEVRKAKELEKTPVRKINLEGIVYTSVFSPIDGRKNWKDIVTAFCTAFQDVADATLVLKMAHYSLSSFLGKFHFFLQQLLPFKCRIVALHGYMDSVEYERLISATHFYISASRGEGLCLPLMEYMACGKPSISPCHTAMVDYVDSSSTIIIDSSLEPCMWPHDSRDVFRTMRYRIDWESLVNAYRRSYDIAKNQPAVYRGMAKAASLQMNKFSSNIAVKEKLRKFFAKELGLPFSD